VIAIRRLEGGKIAEEWSLMDIFGIMQQLGQVPKRG
jgi:predicted ester cyclase